MTTKTLECKTYNDAGDCIEWVIKPEGIYGRVTPEAKICAPEKAKEAQKVLNKAKFFVETNEA